MSNIGGGAFFVPAEPKELGPPVSAGSPALPPGAGLPPLAIERSKRWTFSMIGPFTMPQLIPRLIPGSRDLSQSRTALQRHK